jgi:hypothetical protein
LELRYYGRAPVSRVAELEDPGVTASIYDLENAWWEDQETCECSCHDEEDEEAEADRQGDGRDWAEMVVW